MTKQAKSDERLELERCLTALYVAVSEDVAKDVQTIVMRVINQQAEEIEKLKAELSYCYSNVKYSLEIIAKKDSQITALQSRFDELVKSLEEAERYTPIEVNLALKDSEWVMARRVQSILTKAKGEANVG